MIGGEQEQALLEAFAGWLDGEGLLVGESPDDSRTLAELVGQFREQHTGDLTDLVGQVREQHTGDDTGDAAGERHAQLVDAATADRLGMAGP